VVQRTANPPTRDRPDLLPRENVDPLAGSKSGTGYLFLVPYFGDSLSTLLSTDIDF
jgi:hypothetical protein